MAPETRSSKRKKLQSQAMLSPQPPDSLQGAIDLVKSLMCNKRLNKADKERLLELLEHARAERCPSCAPITPQGTEATSSNTKVSNYSTKDTDSNNSEKTKVSTGIQTSAEDSFEDPPLTLPDIPAWSIERLNNQASALKYENSLYGPIATILSLLFPTRRHFMIKPQGLFRKAAKDETATGELLGGLNMQNAQTLQGFIRSSQEEATDPNATVDSYNGETSTIEFVPDYLVCWADAYIHGDRLLAIIEVKRKYCNRTLAFLQVSEYIARGSTIIGVTGKILAFLIIADEVYVYEVDTSKKPEKGQKISYTRTYPISSPQFLIDLHSIAVANWNGPVARGPPSNAANPEISVDLNPLYN